LNIDYKLAFIGIKYQVWLNCRRHCNSCPSCQS